jgi:hypothetical protein
MIHDTGAAPTSWTRRYDVETASNRLAATSLPGDDDTRYSAKYTYDAHGNMTSMPHLSSIACDSRDQMANARKGDGIVYFTYDAGGERVRKVWEHDGLVEERIYLGVWELYRRFNASDPDRALLERETLHVMDGERRIALVETKTADVIAGGAFQLSTVTRLQLGNHLGSAVLETDESGRVISYEEYHPYGTTAYSSATGVASMTASAIVRAGAGRGDGGMLPRASARAWLGGGRARILGLVDGPNLYAMCPRPLSLVDRRANGLRTSTKKKKSARST